MIALNHQGGTVIIYLGLFIPIVAIAFLIYVYHRDLTWWEIALLFIGPCLCIIISKAIIETITTMDTEYWGGHVVRAEYYEDWDEEVPCRHPIYCTRSVPCSDPKRSGCTESYECGRQHSYDVDYHPPRWQVLDNNKEEFSINNDKFEALAKKWKNRQFVDLHRSYHSKDGDEYIAVWDQQPETCEATTAEHSYENRVGASDSIFNYPEVSQESIKQYNLFKYPPVSGYNQEVVLGLHDQLAERKFQYLNAMLGKPNQVRVFILIFKGQPIQASFEQEALWKRGNKNEFIICIGLDNSTQSIQWARVFSWTEVESLKIDTASYLVSQNKLDLQALADWLYPQIQQHWKRKSFSDFNYLSVEPSGRDIAITWFLTIVLTVGLSWWFVKNDYYPKENI